MALLPSPPQMLIPCLGSFREEREEPTTYKRRKKAEPIKSLDHGAIHLGPFLPSLLALGRVPILLECLSCHLQNKNYLPALIVTKMELKKDCDNIILEELEAPAPSKQKLILATGILKYIEARYLQDRRF